MQPRLHRPHGNAKYLRNFAVPKTLIVCEYHHLFQEIGQLIDTGPNPFPQLFALNQLDRTGRARFEHFEQPVDLAVGGFLAMLVEA